MSTLVGTVHNTRPYFATIATLMVSGVAVAVAGGGHWLSIAIAACLIVAGWLTWVYLTLAMPTLDGTTPPRLETVPGELDRLVVTLKLGGVVSVVAILTGTLFVTTQDPAKVQALAPILWMPVYMFFAGAFCGYQMLLSIAVRNRHRPQPIRRCLADVLDVALTAMFAVIAAIVFFLLAHVVTGLDHQILPIAYVTLTVYLGWRTRPYIAPVFRQLKRLFVRTGDACDVAVPARSVAPGSTS